MSLRRQGHGLRAAALLCMIAISHVDTITPIMDPRLVRLIAAAEQGSTVSISPDLAAAPVSMALHTPLTLRGETSPCSEPCDDHDALPEPLKAVKMPTLTAQAGHVSVFQVSAPQTTRSVLAHLRLRHPGGPCDQDATDDLAELTLEGAASADESKEIPLISLRHQAEGNDTDQEGPREHDAASTHTHQVTANSTALPPSTATTDDCMPLHKETRTRQQKTSLPGLGDAAGVGCCCVGVDSGILKLEACSVTAFNGTSVGVTGACARLVIDQCHIKDSAFGVVAVSQGRVCCTRSLLSCISEAAVVAVGNMTLCELECNVMVTSGYGLSLTEGAKGILEGNMIQDCREAGVSVSGRGSWVRLSVNHLRANGQYGLLVADKAAAVIESGVFREHAYGALVMDTGSYIWVLDPQASHFEENREEGLFAGLGGTLDYNGTVSVGQGRDKGPRPGDLVVPCTSNLDEEPPTELPPHLAHYNFS